MSWFFCIFVALVSVFPGGISTLPGHHKKIKTSCSTLLEDASGKGNYRRCTNGEFEGTFSRKEEGLPTIIVDKSSQSNFSSIQAAVDSVTSKNNNWVSIYVKAGTYNEQVEIPQDKPFIYLKGDGIGKTNIVWSEPNLTSPTFYSMADNIVVSGITFMNSFNYPPNKNANPAKPAVAAKISGDKSAFYDCSFLGYQDTLYDKSGRHYFERCTIEGTIDFIFGNGQSIYQNCTITVNERIHSPITVNERMHSHGSAGYITAQGRGRANDNGGYVFKQCSVIGNGKALLGRAWKAYARVIFYDSFLSDVVSPVGWSAWSFVGHENNITYVEDQCKGPGSDKSERVTWEKVLSSEELKSFTSMSYIDSEGWISKLPQH